MGIDVTEILTDPDLIDSFGVRQRVLTTNNQGRPTTVDTVTQNVIGVVTMADPNDLERGPDMDYATRTISVVTKFPLMTSVKNRQPDTVLWRGDEYVVKHVDLYPQFGPGFYQAICESMDRTDGVMPNNASPDMNFLNAQSSSLIAILC